MRVRSLAGLGLMAVGASLVLGSLLATVVLGRWADRRVPVVVATRDIPPLSPVPAGSVAVRRVPEAAVPRGGAFANTQEVVGRLTAYGVVAGAVVQPAMLLGSGGSELDAALHAAVARSGSDLEAVALPLDASGGFTLPAPGDRVAVLAVATPPGASGPVARVLLPRALVLAVQAAGGGGSSLVPVAGAGSGVLVLALSPSQAEALALAQAIGRVTVALDAPGCPCPAGATPAGPVTLAEVLSGAVPARPTPGRLPPGAGALVVGTGEGR